jgi:hypothetical protein
MKTLKIAAVGALLLGGTTEGWADNPYQKVVNDYAAAGFTEATIEDLAVGEKSGSVFVHGYYKQEGAVGYLFPNIIAMQRDNVAAGLPLLTDEANSETRRHLYRCNNNPLASQIGCFMWVDGTVADCNLNNLFGASHRSVCLKVQGSVWLHNESTDIGVYPQFPIPHATTEAPTERQPGGYRAGVADRAEWEHWFNSKSGSFKDGAEYWAGERSKTRPGSCYALVDHDAQQGCLAAKILLDNSDAKRRTDESYRDGWNSYNG